MRLLSAWIRLARIGARGSVQTPIRARSSRCGTGVPRGLLPGSRALGLRSPAAQKQTSGLPADYPFKWRMAAGPRRIPLQWCGDLSSGRIEPGMASFSKDGEEREGDPGRVGRHSRAPGCPLRKRSALHRIRGAFSSGEETRRQRNRGAVGRCRRRHGAPVLLCGKAAMASGVISKVSLRGWRCR